MHPKLKAIEHTGANGEALQNKYRIEIVDAPKREDEANDSPWFQPGELAVTAQDGTYLSYKGADRRRGRWS